jgi:hypothetical protein
MRALGFDAQPLDPRIENIVHHDWKESNARAALSASVATFVERSAIDELHPDFLIIDTNTWGAQAVAETWPNPGSWVSRTFARQASSPVDDWDHRTNDLAAI